jgi:BMFP domain-containing protein YqiC
MAARAREENEALRRRIDSLEARLQAGTAPESSVAEPAKRGARKRSGGAAASEGDEDL